jgi:protein SCO1
MKRVFLLSALLLPFLIQAEEPASQWQALTPAQLGVRLTDQQGRTVDFYKDLMAGKTTVINFIFTECTQVCPMLTAQFRAIEKQAAAASMKGIQLVSVSVDPERDTAAALRRFAAESEANWIFLSGSEVNVKKLLEAFHLPLQQRDGHTSRFVIASDAAGKWTSVDGFSDVNDIVKLAGDARPHNQR